MSMSTLEIFFDSESANHTASQQLANAWELIDRHG